MTYNLSTGWTIALAAGIIWELIWKGIALWRAARQEQAVWFVCLLVISSIGILPIAYLLSNHQYRHSPLPGRGLA